MQIKSVETLGFRKKSKIKENKISIDRHPALLIFFNYFVDFAFVTFWIFLELRLKFVDFDHADSLKIQIIVLNKTFWQFCWLTFEEFLVYKGVDCLHTVEYNVQ